MQSEQQEMYGTYTYPYQNAPVGVLDMSPRTYTEQGAAPPPWYPPGPSASPPPRKRPGRAGAIVLLAIVLALIFGVGLFSGWEFSRGSTGTTTSAAAASTATSSSNIVTQQEAAIARVEPGVVELQVITAQGEQIGSGVIIDSKGDIVTNNHVVSGEQSIEVVLYNGKTEAAQLVGTNAADDLAVVRIQPYANMTVVQFGDSSKLSIGQDVLAIGNPLGYTETATQGIISALNRSVTESTGTTISNAIQTDAALNPGNSGGALINLQGQLIGIPTLGAINTESNTTAQGISFAIPSDLVQSVVQQIIQQGNQ